MDSRRRAGGFRCSHANVASSDIGAETRPLMEPIMLSDPTSTFLISHSGKMPFDKPTAE